MRVNTMLLAPALTLILGLAACGENETGGVEVINAPDLIADGNVVMIESNEETSSAEENASEGETETTEETEPEEEEDPIPEEVLNYVLEGEFGSYTNPLDPWVQRVIDELNADEYYYKTAEEDFPTSYTFTDDGYRRVCIDPGHQDTGILSREPIAPGVEFDPDTADTTNSNLKVAVGTKGAYTGIQEYETVLAIGLKLEQVLLDRGYQVVMVRRTNDVNISNLKRALIGNETDCDINIHLHVDGYDGSGAEKVGGATAVYTGPNNQWVPFLASYNETLANCIYEEYCEETGYRRRDPKITKDSSGYCAMNWSHIPTILFEMGFSTNPTEDRQMNDDEFQWTMAYGLADGIDAYFEEMESRVTQ